MQVYLQTVQAILNPDLIIEKVSLLIILGNKSFSLAFVPQLTHLFVFIFLFT